MATLQGTKVKDTYLGLLKTSDAGAVTGTLKTVQDGGGNDSALQLATTKVMVEKLEINSPSVTTDTNILTWNQTTKSVGYKALSSAASVSVTYDVTTATEPDLQITDNLGTTKTTAFRGGTNITLDGSESGDTATITFSNDTKTQLTFGTAAGIPAANSGKLIKLKLNTLSSGDVITLPPAAEGVYFDFLIIASNNNPIHIDAASGDRIKGRVTLTSTTKGQSISQIESGSSTDRITLEADSTTTGGSFGDSFRLIAVDGDDWLLDAVLTTTAASPTACDTITGQP